MAKIHLLHFDFCSGSFPNFPHGLAYIIGALRTDKHEVTFSHLMKPSDYEYAANLISGGKPDIIGLSFPTTQKQYVRHFLDNFPLKAELLIAGGSHARLVKELIFEDFPALDGVCIGEGEMPFRELCGRIDKGKEYIDVGGFSFRTDSGIINNPITPVSDLDLLPMPDYSLFDYNRMVRESGGYFQMILSRGCPFDCSYCCNHIFREVFRDKNKYVRLPSPQRAIDIIKKNLLLSPYPKTKIIAFIDDVFIRDSRWLSQFGGLYKKEVGIPYMCNSRIEYVNREVLGYLKESGCSAIELGLESGNEWLRGHVLNRRYSNEAVEEAFALAKEYKIKVGAFIMMGIPFETNSMQKDTIRLCARLRPEFGLVSFFFPFPGTKIFQICSQYGLMLDNLEKKLSGYFAGPSLKEIFNSHEKTIRNHQELQLFFYLRMVFGRYHLPAFFEKAFLFILMPVRKPIFFFLNKSTKNIRMLKLIAALRRLAFGDLAHHE